ncbi:YccF domain-containing protein [Actinomycetaceae bacterium L2_0104]
MGLLLNLIWVVFGGFWLFLGYVVFGLLALIPIVTIPASLASFRIAGYVLWPFGRCVVRQPGAGTGTALMNIVWFLIAGLWLAIGHLVTAAFQAITIIGIPLAVANIKLIPVTCFPFGKMVISKRQAQLRGISMLGEVTL